MSRLETILFRSAAAAVVLHFVDEALLDPPAGTHVGDHWSVLALAAAVAGVAVFYPRLPAVVRALLGFVFVPLAGTGAAMHVMDARWNGAHGSDFTGSSSSRLRPHSSSLQCSQCSRGREPGRGRGESAAGR